VAGVAAVVFDIGGVLEVVDDSLFPAPFLERHGLPPDAIVRASATLPGDAMRGDVTEAEVRDHWRRELGISEAAADLLMADYWRWYVGSLDQALFDWFAALRPRGVRVGILSNSSPGARAAESLWGFEAVTDAIVYSHEVGLMKPDPEVYALTARRLAVEPAAVLFLDDEANIRGARACGWRAVLHQDTPTSIAALEAAMRG
jgi:HAD superfamily hydrolase (TIGR01509 family)